MSIHDCPHSSSYNIPVKKETRYLGIWLLKSKDASEKNNVLKTVDKCKKILNNWLQRDVTLFGRTLLTKMETISRLIYPACSLC